MNPLQTRALTRQQISEFVTSPRGIRAFEAAQVDITNQSDALTNAQFLTLTDTPSLGAERVLTPVAGQIVGTDGGANAPYTLGLADTVVVPGTYGSASKTIAVTVDQKGRLTSAQEFALSTSNIAEGTNLYYTDARARAALSAGTGISYNSGTGAIALDTASNRNVDHSAVSINAGTGLTGGGDLTATRSLALATSGVTAGTYASPTSITVDAYGRITSIT